MLEREKGAKSKEGGWGWGWGHIGRSGVEWSGGQLRGFNSSRESYTLQL